MFAYIHRYQSPNVVLIYPQTDQKVRARFALEEHDAVITVATVDLHRNLGRVDQRQELANELKNLLTLEVPDGAIL